MQTNLFCQSASCRNSFVTFQVSPVTHNILLCGHKRKHYYIEKEHSFFIVMHLLFLLPRQLHQFQKFPSIVVGFPMDT